MERNLLEKELKVLRNGTNSPIDFQSVTFSDSESGVIKAKAFLIKEDFKTKQKTSDGNEIYYPVKHDVEILDEKGGWLFVEATAKYLKNGIETDFSENSITPKLKGWIKKSGVIIKPPAAQTFAELEKRINQYLTNADLEFILPDGHKINVFPPFTYGHKFNGAGGKALRSNYDTKLRKALGNNFYKLYPVNDLLYGRAKPGDIKKITQDLINSTNVAFKVVSPQTEIEAVRRLQQAHGIGIDCAGYVQLSFFYSIYEHDADTPARRTQLGLLSRGLERLNRLDQFPQNKKFEKIKLSDVNSGDLMILKPNGRDSDRAIHTVIIVNHIKTGDVHKFLVDSSWGNDAYGFGFGGIGRRTFAYDEKKDEWWDIHPADPTKEVRGFDDAAGNFIDTSKIGPYKGHPLKGFFRRK